MHEAHYNYSVLCYSKGALTWDLQLPLSCLSTLGDYQQCFNEATAASMGFEEHVDSKTMLEELQKLFHLL